MPEWRRSSGARSGAFAIGLRRPAIGYLTNALLYAAFIAPHLLMARPWFKRAVWGTLADSTIERRAYVFVSIVLWLAVLALQWPLPGSAVPAGPTLTILQFSGAAGLVGSMVLLRRCATFDMLDGLMSTPGCNEQFSHGAERPLMTDGPYAQVRHPMYCATVLIGLSSLALHPNTAQLFWFAAISVRIQREITSLGSAA